MFEFRGVDNLVMAEVTKDNNETGTGEGYVTGEVIEIAPVAEISKTTETSAENKYYDNKPMITINSEGADEITITAAALPLDVLAKITGKTLDPATGALIDGERTNKYYALGYRFKKTDGNYRYVWRLKGSFNIPDEGSATEDDGTDGKNQEVVYTGIMTSHRFTKGGSAKGVVADSEGDTKVSDWFDEVITPDTVASKTPSI